MGMNHIFCGILIFLIVQTMLNQNTHVRFNSVVVSGWIPILFEKQMMKVLQVLGNPSIIILKNDSRLPQKNPLKGRCEGQPPTFSESVKIF